MDLNYLFHRQQVERSLAETAKSAAARDAHQDLASRYEAMIDDASQHPKGRSVFGQDDSPADDSASSVNAPLAVAMTAREVKGA